MSYKFETLQLHIGQEQPDPATDARAVPILLKHSHDRQDIDGVSLGYDLDSLLPTEIEY